ncbi:hypothetical protein FACS189472_11570 [Alphaproteobacteria bacterium]|nr:hypothetical protein FACS189472_11570 [Alphaproteobacteria bacterium]
MSAPVLGFERAEFPSSEVDKIKKTIEHNHKIAYEDTGGRSLVRVVDRENTAFSSIPISNKVIRIDPKSIIQLQAAMKEGAELLIKVFVREKQMCHNFEFRSPDFFSIRDAQNAKYSGAKDITIMATRYKSILSEHIPFFGKTLTIKPHELELLQKEITPTPLYYDNTSGKSLIRLKIGAPDEETLSRTHLGDKLIRMDEKSLQMYALALPKEKTITIKAFLLDQHFGGFDFNPISSEGGSKK